MLYEDDAKNLDLIRLLGSAFIQRRDAKAIQQSGGGWNPVREDSANTNSPLLPWTMMDFRFHLGGQRTYGHYMLDKDNTCKLFAFDLDVRKPDKNNPDEFQCEAGTYNPRDVWLGQQVDHEMYADIKRQLTGMAMALSLAIKELFGPDIRVAVADTGGKGLHVYGLYGEMPAVVARQAATGILEQLEGFIPHSGDNFFRYSTPENPDGYSAISVEVFPKQDTVDTGGFGNLMALPCGIHQVTKRPKSFVHFHSTPESPDSSAEWVHVDPIEALTGNTPWVSDAPTAAP